MKQGLLRKKISDDAENQHNKVFYEMVNHIQSQSLRKINWCISQINQEIKDMDSLNPSRIVSSKNLATINNSQTEWGYKPFIPQQVQKKYDPKLKQDLKGLQKLFKTKKRVVRNTLQKNSIDFGKLEDSTSQLLKRKVKDSLQRLKQNNREKKYAAKSMNVQQWWESSPARPANTRLSLETKLQLLRVQGQEEQEVRNQIEGEYQKHLAISWIKQQENMKYDKLGYIRSKNCTRHHDNISSETHDNYPENPVTPEQLPTALRERRHRKHATGLEGFQNGEMKQLQKNIRLFVEDKVILQRYFSDYLDIHGNLLQLDNKKESNAHHQVYLAIKRQLCTVVLGQKLLKAKTQNQMFAPTPEQREHVCNQETLKKPKASNSFVKKKYPDCEKLYKDLDQLIISLSLGLKKAYESYGDTSLSTKNDLMYLTTPLFKGRDTQQKLRTQKSTEPLDRSSWFCWSKPIRQEKFTTALDRKSQTTKNSFLQTLRKEKPILKPCCGILSFRQSTQAEKEQTKRQFMRVIKGQYGQQEVLRLSQPTR